MLHFEYTFDKLPGRLRWACPPRPMFETDRLSVRRLTAGDTRELHEVYSDRDAMRFVDDGEPITWEETLRWIEITQRNYEVRGYGMSRIALRDTDELVGFCGLVHPGAQEEVEIKYALRRRHWGQGYATEAVRAMLNHGHDVLGLDRVIATVDPDNHASLHVLAKAGMTERGRTENDDGSVTVTLVWHAGT